MTRWGAEASDWLHFDLLLGLGSELLPCVCNPDAVISPLSKIKELGKLPTKYNYEGKVSGIERWTAKHSTADERDTWRRQPDYGIFIQARAVRAIDVDIEDVTLAAEVEAFINLSLGRSLPARGRADSAKVLFAFRLGGAQVKQIIRTAHGVIEMLADGQGWVASGVHKKGQRYAWRGGLPDELPSLSAEQFDTLWHGLAERFALSGQAATARPAVRRVDQLERARHDDPIAQYLIDNSWWLGNNRDGSLNITCPFASEHTSETGESSTTYWPAHTGGFAQGHFKCLHAHCAERTDADFLIGCGYEGAQFGLLEPKAPGEPSRSDEPTVTFERRRTKNGGLGRVIANLNNLKLALEHEHICGAVIEFDTMLTRRLIAWTGEAPREFRESDEVMLCERLEKGVTAGPDGALLRFEPIGENLIRRALVAHDSRTQKDGGKQWVEALPGWDGESRVEHLLPRYFGADDTPYARAVSRYWMTAMVGRILVPGAKADMAIVLTGWQGAGKTEALRLLAPTEERYAELDFGDSEKERAEKCRDKTLIELGELKNLHRREAAEVKAWLSRRVDEWREPYQRYTTRIPRRWIAVGTTNEQQFLFDGTGERRWLPIAVSGVDLKLLGRDKLQLYAEAVERWRERGIEWQDAERLAREIHDDFKVDDPRVEMLLDWENTEEWDGGRPADRAVSMREVLVNAFNLKPREMTKAAQMDYARVLQQAGRVRRTITEKIAGKNVQRRVWLREKQT